MVSAFEAICATEAVMCSGIAVLASRRLVNEVRARRRAEAELAGVLRAAGVRCESAPALNLALCDRCSDSFRAVLAEHGVDV